MASCLLTCMDMLLQMLEPPHSPRIVRILVAGCTAVVQSVGWSASSETLLYPLGMSGGAPGWVAYAAVGTSALAVTVSSVAARVAYLSYRASGPRLRLDVAHKETDRSAQRVIMALHCDELGTRRDQRSRLQDHALWPQTARS
jgi:hypothetical protein